MAEHKLEAVLELKDKFTATITQAKKQFNQLESNVNSSVSKAGSKFENFERIIRRSGKTMSNGLSAIRGTAVKFNNILNSITGGFFGAQMALRAVDLGKGIITQGFSDYIALQDKLVRNSALMGTSTEKTKEMNDQVKELGRTTEYTAGQVADVHKYFAMAGWNPDGIKVATKPVLEFASATGTDLANAADIASDYLTAFEMKAEELPHLLDVMSTTALKSNTNIQFLAESFKGMAGLNKGRDTIEDLGIISGLLANMGVKGGDTGTFYKSMVLRLTGGSTEVTKAAKALGVSFYDTVYETTNGKKVAKKVNKDTLTILSDIGKAMQNFDIEGQNKLLANLFGINHAGNAKKLINSLATEDYPRLRKEMQQSSGSMENLYKKITTESPEHKVQMLKSAWDGLKLSFGEAAAPTAFKYMDQWTKKLGDLSKKETFQPEKMQQYFDSFVSKAGLAIKAIAGIKALLLLTSHPYAATIVISYVIGKKIGQKVGQVMSDKYEKGLTKQNESIQNTWGQLKQRDPEKYMKEMNQYIDKGNINEMFLHKGKGFSDEVDLQGRNKYIQEYNNWLKTYNPEQYKQRMEKERERTMMTPRTDSMFPGSYLGRISDNKTPYTNKMPSITNPEPPFKTRSENQSPINFSPEINVNVNGKNLEEVKQCAEEEAQKVKDQIVNSIMSSMTQKLQIGV